MLQEGPEIARRADRVGVLPLAPVARNRPKTISRSDSYFHLWAHSEPVGSILQSARSVHNYGMPSRFTVTGARLVHCYRVCDWFIVMGYIYSKAPANHPKVPTPGAVGCVCRFARMLEEGPEIARRADRVGVLPLAPVGRNRPKTISQSNSFFHLWAHSASPVNILATNPVSFPTLGTSEFVSFPDFLQGDQEQRQVLT